MRALLVGCYAKGMLAHRQKVEKIEFTFFLGGGESHEQVTYQTIALSSIQPYMVDSDICRAELRAQRAWAIPRNTASASTGSHGYGCRLIASRAAGSLDWHQQLVRRCCRVKNASTAAHDHDSRSSPARPDLEQAERPTGA